MSVGVRHFGILSRLWGWAVRDRVRRVRGWEKVRTFPFRVRPRHLCYTFMDACLDKGQDMSSRLILVKLESASTCTVKDVQG